MILHKLEKLVMAYKFFKNLLKDLSVGDIVSFVVWETKKRFAKAKLIYVNETIFANLNNNDWDGHEKFENEKEMYDTYSTYYNRPVNNGSLMKIIKFELL